MLRRRKGAQAVFSARLVLLFRPPPPMLPLPKRRLPVILVLLCLIPQLFSNCYTGYKKTKNGFVYIDHAFLFP